MTELLGGLPSILKPLSDDHAGLVTAVREPDCGAGTFIGLAPEGIHMSGVELDATSARIAQALCPSAKIRTEGYQSTPITHLFGGAVGDGPVRHEVVSRILPVQTRVRSSVDREHQRPGEQLRPSYPRGQIARLARPRQVAFGRARCSCLLAR